jgi:hypothetical protein
VLGFVGTSAAVAGPAVQGPSSSQTPYLEGSQPGVVTKSIISVGDADPNGYRMVGIPDGLGTYDNGDGTFTVLMNQELGTTEGSVRAHGQKGAFVSKWTVDTKTLAVKKGEDLIKQVKTWDPATSSWNVTPTAFNRFCSADLPDASAFYNAASGKGTQNRIFMNGEEAGAEGRAVAHVASGPEAGTSYILPWLGRAGFENQLAMPGAGDKTVVIGTDDSNGGQIYVYVGDKKSTGNDVERAGLTGGTLYGLKIEGVGTESDATTVADGGAGFSLVEIPGAATMTGAQLETASNSLGVSKLARPEDGAWDPSNPGGFYFATTASFSGTSRLWHLDFSDVSDVLAGGKANIALASPPYQGGSANENGPRMMDNLTVNRRGQVLIQEDPGSQDYVSGVFQYDPNTGTATRVARHDADRFTPGVPGFLTKDEESSGIIPAPFLGEGKYLFDVQAHYGTGDAETVQGGQLGVLQVPPVKPVG